MIRRIKQGKADLAFINLPYADDELIIRECLPIHDIFVAGARFEARSSYSPAQIAALPLILLEKNSTSRRSIDAYFARHHIALQPQIEIAAHELLLQFASIHLGVSCVIDVYKIQTLGGVKPNPRLSKVREGIALAQQEDVDFLLAVGGGSVIDSAKAIAYGLSLIHI